MKIILRIFVVTVSVVMCFDFSAEAQVVRERCAYELGVKSSALDLIECLRQLTAQIERSEKTIARLRSDLSQVNEEVRAGVPAGAVAAFDLVKGCPPGWSEFQQAAGRFVLGVGAGNEDENGEFLSERALSDTGGEEEVTLTEAQIPRHRHAISSQHRDVGPLHDGFGGSPRDYGLRPNFDPNPSTVEGWSRALHKNFMEPIGQGKAHNNMPPYIALYFCKKD